MNRANRAERSVRTGRTERTERAERIKGTNGKDARVNEVKGVKGRNLRKPKLLIILLIAAVVAGASFFAANRYLFKVRNWTINISGGSISREDVIMASGIEEGAELFGFDRAAAKNNIKRELTHVTNVNMIRFPPSTLRIDVKTESAAMGIMLGGDYYIISENFRVLERIRMYGRALEYVKPPGVVNIVTNDVTRCFVGEKIEFGDSDIMDFLKEFLKLRRRHEAADMISSIDIRDKFNVVMDYSGLYSVNFGVFENVYAKALNSFDVIDHLYERGLTGTIDVSDMRRAVFSPN